MKITIVAVGKLKERFWKEACAEYEKRLRSYANVRIVEVQDRDPAKYGGESKAMELEGQDIEKALGSSHVILLAIDGKPYSSPEFSKRLDKLALTGKSDISFVIGGSTGVCESIRKRADESLSFGRITLPHNLARVVLLEQIYRAFKISRKEPYHK